MLEHVLVLGYASCSPSVFSSDGLVLPLGLYAVSILRIIHEFSNDLVRNITSV